MRIKTTKKLSLGYSTVSNLDKILGGVRIEDNADLDFKAASCFVTCFPNFTCYNECNITNDPNCNTEQCQTIFFTNCKC